MADVRLAQVDTAMTDSPPRGVAPTQTGGGDGLQRNTGAAVATTFGQWDMIRAEMMDTARGQARPKQPCRYCGIPTSALSGVCTAHRDLPRLDPHSNVQAARFNR